MTYTIEFFDGKAKHVSDEEGKAVAKAKFDGRPSVAVAGIVCDSKVIAKVLTFSEWRREEEQKLIVKKKEIFICDFGQFHPVYEKCHCKDDGLPCCMNDMRITKPVATPILPPVVMHNLDGSSSPIL